MSRSPSSPLGSDPIDIENLRPPFAPRDETSRWLFGLQRLGIRPGLDSIRELLSRMGDPQDHVEAVVVAGTNGKGSAALVLEALARSAGLRTGLYTSPHLLDIRERIRIDGEMIPRAELARLVRKHRGAIEETGATFFEALTAITLEWFRREGTQVAVLETGLGGRLDATNVVRKAGLVLTSVGLDHQELLGHSLEAIAREKLGLAAPGVPFYLDDLGGSLRRLAVDAIREAGGEPVLMDDLPAAEAPRARGIEGKLQLRQISRMQPVWEDLARRRGWPAAEPVGALTGLDLSGRYDVRGRSPRLILDTAHNAHALDRVLAQFGGEGDRSERVLVFASVHGKEIDPILPVLGAVASSILVCAPRWYRAVEPADLARRIRAASADSTVPIEVVGSVRKALEAARAAVPSGRVLVTGSNFLVAEALDRLGIDSLDERGPGPWDRGEPLRRRPTRHRKGTSR
jgi:folylpolyglutamate synthase/dihydrofolate synthase